MTTMPGAGPVVAMTCKAAVEDPAQSRKSKHTGPQVGLTPKLDKSGERSVTGEIFRTGDIDLHSALYHAAHMMLSRDRENRFKTQAQQLLQKGEGRTGAADQVSSCTGCGWMTPTSNQPVTKNQSIEDKTSTWYAFGEFRGGLTDLFLRGSCRTW
ncbi:MAG: IS110 family transposase [Rhodobacteraceae bacterium]|nr:IS110 family transposase [Paracoccaceae bacterium]